MKTNVLPSKKLRVPCLFVVVDSETGEVVFSSMQNASDPSMARKLSLDAAKVWARSSDQFSRSPGRFKIYRASAQVDVGDELSFRD